VLFLTANVLYHLWDEKSNYFLGVKKFS